MDGRKRRCNPGSASRHLCVEILEDKLLLSPFASASVVLGPFIPVQKAGTILARTDNRPGSQSQQAHLDLYPGDDGARRTPDWTFLDHEESTGKRPDPGSILLMPDPDSHPLDPDDRDATAQGSERQQLAMLEAVSEAGSWLHAAVGTAVREDGKPDADYMREPARAKPLQPLALDAARIPALPANLVSRMEAQVTTLVAQSASLAHDTGRQVSSLSGIQSLSDRSEISELRSKKDNPPPGHDHASPLMLLASAPVAGLLPLDLKALLAGMDRFLAQLADLGKSWDDPRLAMEVVLWLTTVMAVAFEFARLQARRSMCRSFVEDNVLSGVTLPLMGDDL